MELRKGRISSRYERLNEFLNLRDRVMAFRHTCTSDIRELTANPHSKRKDHLCCSPAQIKAAIQ